MPSANKTAGKKLKYSEEGRGHSRARHAHPTLPAGPSIDAFLKQRFRNGNGALRNGDGVMTAFYEDDHQDRAVAFAYAQVKSHTVNGIRTTMAVTTGGTLNDIVVRVVQKTGDDMEGFDAKLRGVIVVVDNLGKDNEVIVTAYPSAFYRK